MDNKESIFSLLGTYKIGKKSTSQIYQNLPKFFDEFSVFSSRTLVAKALVVVFFFSVTYLTFKFFHLTFPVT